MPLLLHVQHGRITGEHNLAPGVTRIGRALDNDICLDDSTVSGRHSTITVMPSAYLEGTYDVFVDDLQSTNGTQVNGQPVQRHRLHNEDILRIGSHEFKFVTRHDTLAASTRLLLGGD